MRIRSIHISHFLGIERADITIHAPVCLVAGQNGAGKSSLRDGVALALTGDLGRVGLKKEAPALIREGADLAVCEVTDDDGDRWAVSINRSGKIHDSHEKRGRDGMLPYVLDAQQFARLAPSERRAFLFGLMGVKTDPATVKERLTVAGHAAAHIERIAPLLRSGFDAASKDAKAKATEAKGGWRAATGETYGSEKAKGWKAAVPAYDAAALAKLSTELQHLDVAISGWQEQIGKLVAEESRRAQLRSNLPALRDSAAMETRRADKLAADQVSLAHAEKALQAAQEAAGVAPRVGLVHDLAKALYDLIGDFFPDSTEDHETQSVRVAGATLEAYFQAHGAYPADGKDGDPEARAKLPELQRQLTLMQSAVANAQRDLDAARAAKAKHAEVEAELAEVFDAAALADARTQVDTLKTQRAAKTAELDKLKSIKALVDAAEETTKKAATLAADVAAWDALGDALGPDGIPAQLLAEALGPLNERLAQHAADTEWHHIQVTPDMQIKLVQRDREYRLLSESEKWRCDAMLAEAIAHLSGCRLLVLDGGDVLDLEGRGQLIGWLDVLAEAGEIDTALLFMTLKALPSGLPSTFHAHWISDGRVQTEQEEQPCLAAA